jgi:hypothetical protein
MLAKKRNGFKKRRAIYLLVACQQDEKVAAREIGIKLKTLQKWMKEENFKEEYEKAMQRIEAFDAKYRAKQNKLLATKIYNELHRRVSCASELHELPVPSLIRIARELNQEVRIDTPGDVTSRGEVTHKHQTQDELIAKYKEQENNSSNQKPPLRLVEPPEEDKETANG